MPGRGDCEWVIKSGDLGSGHGSSRTFIIGTLGKQAAAVWGTLQVLPHSKLIKLNDVGVLSPRFTNEERDREAHH